MTRATASKSKLRERIRRAFVLTYALVRIPFVLPIDFLDELRFWVRLRGLAAGGAEKAWERLVSLWSNVDTFYGGPVGPSMDRVLEDVVARKFVRAYPDSDRVVCTTLNHSNPYVCAYSIRTLCRLMLQRGLVPKRTDFPESLFARDETIQEQSFCFGSAMRLGDVPTRSINDVAAILKRRAG